MAAQWSPWTSPAPPNAGVASGSPHGLHRKDSPPLVVHWSSDKSSRRFSAKTTAYAPTPVVVHMSQGGSALPPITTSPSRGSYPPKIIRDSGSGGWSGMRVTPYQTRRFWGGQNAMAYQTQVIVDSQPQGVSTSYSFSNQGAWNSDMCDCCADMSVCLCSTFCPCIFACRVAEQAGECCCLPYLPGTLIAMRTGVRERYHIEGSICGDWMVMVCCPCCGLCQLSRELSHRT